MFLSLLHSRGEELSWVFSLCYLDQQVNSLTRSSFHHLRNIVKLKPVVPQAELEMSIHAFVSSRLDYCNSIFTCLSNTSLNHLQVDQNAAAKLLTKSSKRSHVTHIFMSLHWLPINFRIQFKIPVHRALHGQAPSYIIELLRPYNTSRTLRSSDQGLLVVPHITLKTEGDYAFEVVAPNLWNCLLLELRAANSVDIFKKHLKTRQFRCAFF